MGRKFEDSSGSDLPVGSFEPCQLLSITRHEPSEQNLAKFPDMKPSLCFRFMLYRPDDPELHGSTSIRFCSDTVSKLGALYGFVTDLCDGIEPTEFDESDYVDSWYRVTVRKKQKSDKLHVSTASPCDAPDDVEDDWSESDELEKARKKAKKRAKKAKKAEKSATGQFDEELAAAVASDDDEEETPF